ncbi:L-ribulose-5-phosphate 4-epimerase AraD [Candidatus Marinimicrobia bacterium]|nr:L-ribulose-5-phosphate 4-epimerase AraD [Candidatus Neomarinimicrobiota bacterium]
MKSNSDFLENRHIYDQVSNANSLLIQKNLVIQNFGNASRRFHHMCLIKGSGIDSSKVKSSDIVAVELKTGRYSSHIKPSTDTPTHIELYKSFSDIGGIVHSHSPYATAWAQAAIPIPCLGTTHADYWSDEIPITRSLTDKEINDEYERETGKVIIEKIKELNVDPLDCPGILVENHGSFTWGKTVEGAVKHAELLEYIARLAWLSLSINSDAKSISKILLNKHFTRKHGPEAYYGQDSE